MVRIKMSVLWKRNVARSVLLRYRFHQMTMMTNMSEIDLNQFSSIVSDEGLRLHLKRKDWVNRPIPSLVQPLFQGEPTCDVFVVNISFHSY